MTWLSKIHSLMKWGKVFNEAFWIHHAKKVWKLPVLFSFDLLLVKLHNFNRSTMKVVEFNHYFDLSFHDAEVGVCRSHSTSLISSGSRDFVPWVLWKKAITDSIAFLTSDFNLPSLWICTLMPHLYLSAHRSPKQQMMWCDYILSFK